MAEREYIFEESNWEYKRGIFSASSYIEYGDSETHFSVHTEILVTNAKGVQSEICNLSVSFEVSNPIEPVTFIISATSAYGLCVAWKMSKFTVSKTVKSYRRWVRNNPRSKVWNRIKGTGRELVSSSGGFRKKVKETVWECVELGTIFGAEDD